MGIRNRAERIKDLTLDIRSMKDGLDLCQYEIDRLMNKKKMMELDLRFLESEFDLLINPTHEMEE